METSLIFHQNYPIISTISVLHETLYYLFPVTKKNIAGVFARCFFSVDCRLFSIPNHRVWGKLEPLRNLLLLVPVAGNLFVFFGDRICKKELEAAPPPKRNSPLNPSRKQAPKEQEKMVSGKGNKAKLPSYTWQKEAEAQKKIVEELTKNADNPERQEREFQQKIFESSGNNWSPFSLIDKNGEISFQEKEEEDSFACPLKNEESIEESTAFSQQPEHIEKAYSWEKEQDVLGKMMEEINTYNENKNQSLRDKLTHFSGNGPFAPLKEEKGNIIFS